MSLESNLGSAVLMIILRAFDELSEYNFVWNFESELDDLPASTENVVVHKFLPQNDILAHPNVIAFILHSELLSTQEAFYHGVPMIGEHREIEFNETSIDEIPGVPLSSFQKGISSKSVNLGVAVELEFCHFTEASLRKAIVTVVEDLSYREKAKKLSKRFRDKPQKPLDLAVWWVEYVIRNPTTEHLKSPTLNMSLIAIKSYDVFLVPILALYALLCLIVKRIGKPKSNKKKKE